MFCHFVILFQRWNSPPSSVVSWVFYFTHRRVAFCFVWLEIVHEIPFVTMCYNKPIDDAMHARSEAQREWNTQSTVHGFTCAHYTIVARHLLVPSIFHLVHCLCNSLSLRLAVFVLFHSMCLRDEMIEKITIAFHLMRSIFSWNCNKTIAKKKLMENRVENRERENVRQLCTVFCLIWL